MTNSEQKNETNEFDAYLIDDYIQYSVDGIKNYIVGRNSYFSFYYAQLITELIRGIDKLVKLMGNKERPIVDCVHHEIGDEISNFMTYLGEFNEKDVRNIKKDTIDNILKILKTFRVEQILPKASLL